MSREVVLTYVSGPSDPVTMADGPGTYVEAQIAAPPESVWPMVSDINLPAEFSEEFQGAEWKDEWKEVGPTIGACFVGRNVHDVVGTWEAECFIHAYEPGRSFGWSVVSLEVPAAQWQFDLEPSDGGTKLRFSTTLGPGPSGLTPAITSMPDKEPAILYVRLKEHNENMQRTVDGIKAKVES